MQVQNILKKNISRPINGVVKADQLNETPQVTLQVTPQVTQLLGRIKGAKSRSQLMHELNLKDRMNFSRKYLEVALALNLIERTQPDTPNSPTQKYRLTVKGQQIKNKGMELSE